MDRRHTRRDLKFALRTMRRAPGSALTAVSVIALGIGAMIGRLHAVHHVPLRPPPPFPEPDRRSHLPIGCGEKNDASKPRPNFTDSARGFHQLQRDGVVLLTGTRRTARTRRAAADRQVRPRRTPTCSRSSASSSSSVAASQPPDQKATASSVAVPRSHDFAVTMFGSAAAALDQLVSPSTIGRAHRRRRHAAGFRADANRNQ